MIYEDSPVGFPKISGNILIVFMGITRVVQGLLQLSLEVLKIWPYLKIESLAGPGVCVGRGEELKLNKVAGKTLNQCRVSPGTLHRGKLRTQ